MKASGINAQRRPGFPGRAKRGAILVAERLVAKEHGNSVHRLFAPVDLKLIQEHTRATENHCPFLEYASIPMIVNANGQDNNDSANQR